MKRKSTKNTRLAFTLLLLFSFTLGFLPGSLISTSAEEVQQITDSAFDTNNPESLLPIEENQLDLLEEEIILDKAQEELNDNTVVEDDEIIEEKIVDIEKEDNALDEEYGFEKEEIKEETLNKLDESKETKEEIIEEKEISDLEENIDEEYRFEKELEPNRPIGDSDTLIMIPTLLFRSRTAMTTQEFTDTIGVNKTAKRILGYCRIYEVDLTITGTPQKAPVDVVLVIDRSGSMGYIAESDKTRLYYAKQAAINFADRVLGSNGIPGSRVSVVSFSGPTSNSNIGNQTQARIDVDLTNDLTTVTSKINDLSANGGTNTEAGFKEGQAVIQGSTSNQNPNSNKVVIMLTDGLPTASNGQQYAETTDINHPHIQSAITAGKSIHENNIADVFTIGLTTGLGSIEKLLADSILTQTKNKGYYPAPSPTDLDAIFTAISQSLGYAATNAEVVDKIGDNFNLIESSLPPGATYDATTREIKWIPGTIGNSAQLKYKVQANPEFAGGLANTNEFATLTYQDINGNEGKTIDFPVPKVNVPTPNEISLTDVTIVQGVSISLGTNTDSSGQNYMSPVTGGDNDGETFIYAWREFGNTEELSQDKNPSVSPIRTTKYEVTVTDSNGCIATATMTVNVIPTTTSFTATKVWVGGPKPISEVRFRLYRTLKVGEPIDNEVPLDVDESIDNIEPIPVGEAVQLTGDSYTWTELEQTNSDGIEYIYSFKESTIPANYTASYDGNTVINTYIPPVVIVDPPNPTSVTITAIKTMDGLTPIDGAFTFELVNDTNFVQQTKTNLGQSITFDPLQFERTGTFNYTLREVIGSDDTITYDATQYSITIDVTRNNNGDYQANVSILRNNIAYDGNLVFANVTKPVEIPDTGGEEPDEEPVPEEEPGELPDTGGGEQPKPDEVPEVEVEKPGKLPNTGGEQPKPNQLPKTGETQTALPFIGVIMILGGMMISLRKKRIK